MARRIVQRQSQTIYEGEDERPRRRRGKGLDAGGRVVIIASCVGGFFLSWFFLPQMGVVHSTDELTAWSLIIAAGVGLLAKRYV